MQRQRGCNAPLGHGSGPLSRATLTTWTTSALRSFSRRRLRFSARRRFFSWTTQGKGIWVWELGKPRSLRPQRSASWQNSQGGEGLSSRLQVVAGGVWAEGQQGAMPVPTGPEAHCGGQFLTPAEKVGTWSGS